MICSTCQEFKPLERNGSCANCNAIARKSGRVKVSDNGKAINRLSPKSKDVERRYLNRLKTWKRGKKCMAKFKHECSKEIECHHMVGRGNYFYDEYATKHEIILTLDERFWMPLCHNAHVYVTENSRWACENGYSFLKITDPVFVKQSV